MPSSTHPVETFDYAEDGEVTSKENNRLTWLEKLLAFGEAEIRRIGVPASNRDLRWPLLLSNTIAVQQLARSAVVLAKDKEVLGIPSLLRSMAEGFINIKYVIADNSQMRARAHILDDHTSRIKLCNKVLSSQSGRSDFLGKSLKEWKALRDQLVDEAEELRQQHGQNNLNWLNLWERARGAKEEATYLTVFWLFSQDVHLTSRGTSKFVEEDEHGNLTFIHNPPLADDVARYLLTCYSLYLMFLKFCSDHFRIPTAPSLEPFEERLKSLVS